MKNKSFAYKLGYVFGAIMVSCIAILLSVAIIALTAKAIAGLLIWLF